MPTVYRYDDREFADGDPITSRGDHLPRLSKAEAIVENALRNTPERKHIRSTSLYTWRDLDWAQKAWNLVRKTHNLYELEIDMLDVVSTGDATHWNLIIGAPEDRSAIDHLVAHYWDQTIVRVRWEILVKKGIVRKKLFAKGHPAL